jgi:hypothetical protein
MPSSFVKRIRIAANPLEFQVLTVARPLYLSRAGLQRGPSWRGVQIAVDVQCIRGKEGHAAYSRVQWNKERNCDAINQHSTYSNR